MVILLLRNGLPPACADAQAVVASAMAIGARAEVHLAPRGAAWVTEVHLTSAIGEPAVAALRALPAVEQVVEVRQPYRVVGRHRAMPRLAFEYQGLGFGGGDLVVAAALAARATDGVDALIARVAALATQGARAVHLRRRSELYAPPDFEMACLPSLLQAAARAGVRALVVEVETADDIERAQQALAREDRCGLVLSIGVHQAQDFRLLEAAGRQREMPVMCRRGAAMSLDEALHACEYVAAAGQLRALLVLAGVRSSATAGEVLSDAGQIPAARAATRLPIAVEPPDAPSAGDDLPSAYHLVAQAAIAGADVILAPPVADFGRLMRDVAVVRAAWHERMLELRGDGAEEDPLCCPVERGP